MIVLTGISKTQWVAILEIVWEGTSSGPSVPSRDGGPAGGHDDRDGRSRTKRRLKTRGAK
jgi:hypothetical protein